MNEDQIVMTLLLLTARQASRRSQELETSIAIERQISVLTPLLEEAPYFPKIL